MEILPLWFIINKHIILSTVSIEILINVQMYYMLFHSELLIYAYHTMCGDIIIYREQLLHTLTAHAFIWHQKCVNCKIACGILHGFHVYILCMASLYCMISAGQLCLFDNYSQSVDKQKQVNGCKIQQRYCEVCT